MTLDFCNLKDDALLAAVNEAVTLHVCNWPWCEDRIYEKSFWCRHKTRDGRLWLGEPYQAICDDILEPGEKRTYLHQFHPPDWAQSFERVQMLLDKEHCWQANKHAAGFGYAVEIYNGGEPQAAGKGTAPTLPIAACYALLASHGIQVFYPRAISLSTITTESVRFQS